MIELTEQQQRAVDDSQEPLRLLDPRTNRTYVLVGAETYERIKGLLEGDEGLSMREVAALVERAMREDDAGDPTLEYYQQKYGVSLQAGRGPRFEGDAQAEQ
jgi:hypothetical protein